MRREEDSDKTFEFWQKSQTFRKTELIGSKEEKVVCYTAMGHGALAACVYLGLECVRELMVGWVLLSFQFSFVLMQRKLGLELLLWACFFCLCHFVIQWPMEGSWSEPRLSNCMIFNFFFFFLNACNLNKLWEEPSVKLWRIKLLFYVSKTC